MTSLAIRRSWKSAFYGPRWVFVVGAAVVCAYLYGLVHAMNHWVFSLWILLIIAPILLAVGFAIIRVVTRNDEQPNVGFLFGALIAKMLASFVRFFVSFSLYGSGDALQYHRDATFRANQFFDNNVTLWDLITPRMGTKGISDLAAMLYSFIGPTRLGGYLVFSWAGYWGLFLFYRAFRTGLPEGRQRRYRWLVFGLPSLMFWPSSIGKEAVMMLAIGAASLGAARISRRLEGGWRAVAIGLAIGALIRPHVSAVILAALTVTVMFRRPPDANRGWGVSGRFLGVAALAVGLSVMFGQTARYLVPKSSGSNVDVVTSALDKASSATADGSSEIDRPLPNNPFEYPGAAFTVLFRPTVAEARSLQTLVAAAETSVLLALAIVQFRRYAQIPTLMFRRPYVLYVLVFTAIFCFAWSAFSNLGILARQRVQVWPLLCVLLCLPENDVGRAIGRRAPAQRSTEETPASAVSLSDGQGAPRHAAPRGSVELDARRQPAHASRSTTRPGRHLLPAATPKDGPRRTR